MEVFLDAKKLKTIRRVLLTEANVTDDPIEDIPAEVLDNHMNLITVHFCMKRILRQMKSEQEEI